MTNRFRGSKISRWRRSVTGNLTNSVIVVPHSHWDREWYLPFEAFRMRLVKLVDTLCRNLDSDPFDTFHLDGQTIALEDYEEIRGPSEDLRRLVASGRIQVGPWYVLPDEFLPTGEAIIRNLQRGLKIARAWGEPPPVAYLPDMFGHIGQMPQILKGLGIEHALLWRGVPPHIDKCGFIWRAPDSSEVFGGMLPLGYSNGFNLPPEPESVRARLVFTRAAMAKFVEGPTWLLMAGTDHQQPQAGLYHRLQRAVESLEGWEARLSDLSEYFERLKKESSARPVAEGELRNTHYAPVLPGTSSARMYLKKRDFEVSGLLEREAEPMATWARALGGPDLRDFLDHAWKLLLQNHPHDSICGCSTDDVHAGMETRYDRAETVARRIFNEASEYLGKMLKTARGEPIGVWKPAGDSSPTPLTVEIEGRLPKNPALLSPDGETCPLQIIEKTDPGRVMASVDVPAIAADLAVGMALMEEEMLGGYIVRAKTEKLPDGLRITVGIGDSPNGLDIERAREKLKKSIAKSGVGRLNLQVIKEPKTLAAAVIGNQAPFSLKAFNIVKDETEPQKALGAGNDFITNEFYKVIARNNGGIEIVESATGRIFKNALNFTDEGDRGDEYNFEPADGDVAVTQPRKSSCRVLYRGPAAACMRIKSAYRIPARYDRKKASRSRKTVSLETTTDVVLYARVPWIEFRTAFHNAAEDHRLRVLFEAPFTTNELICESSFEVVRRKADVSPEPRKPDPNDIISLLVGPETEVGYGPHKGFAALESGDFGMALFNRGLPEIEAVPGEEGTALALTLARCVGMLSRDDLTLRTGHAGPPLETPGAQCPGGHVCEFAFITYNGSWQEADLPAKAHAYRHPPRAFRIRGGGDLPSPASPVTSDNPAVEISALQPAPDGSDAVCARVYNTTGKNQTARISMADCFGYCSEADLMGNPLPDNYLKRPGADGFILELPPAKIVTLRLDLKD